jgi:hypothetical protein
MSMTTLAVLGISSAILNCIGFIPYVRAIRHGKTKPERASWWIWTVLILVALAAQAAAGATWSLFLTGGLFAGDVVVALLSLRYGYGRFKPVDAVSLGVAAVGIGLWKLTNNPLAALVVIVGVDFLGNWLTLMKSWRAPYTENVITWVFMSIAAIAGILSVGSLNPTKIIFPAYVVIANCCTAAALIYRRHWRKQRILAGQKAIKKTLLRH